MTEDADDRKLERAAIGNHRDLFRMNAEAMDGEVCEDGGLVYTYDAASRNALACWMDGERLHKAFLILPMRFVYRPLLAWVIWRSIFRALKGAFVAWGKLERTASVPSRA